MIAIYGKALFHLCLSQGLRIAIHGRILSRMVKERNKRGKINSALKPMVELFLDADPVEMF